MPEPKYIINTTDHRIVRDKHGFPMLRFTLTHGLVPSSGKDEDAALATITGCIGSFGGGETLEWQGPLMFLGRKLRSIMAFTPVIRDAVLKSLEICGGRAILWDRITEYREGRTEERKAAEMLTLPISGYLEVPR
jgi:hypothetical protein